MSLCTLQADQCIFVCVLVLFIVFVCGLTCLCKKKNMHTKDRSHCMLTCTQVTCTCTCISTGVWAPVSAKPAAALLHRQFWKACYFLKVEENAHLICPGLNTPLDSRHILTHRSRQTVCHGDPQSRFLWWGRWAAVRGRVATLKLIMSRLLSCWSRNETWAVLPRTWLPPLDTAGDQQQNWKGAETWK